MLRSLWSQVLIVDIVSEYLPIRRHYLHPNISTTCAHDIHRRQRYVLTVATLGDSGLQTRRGRSDALSIGFPPHHATVGIAHRGVIIADVRVPASITLHCGIYPFATQCIFIQRRFSIIGIKGYLRGPHISLAVGAVFVKQPYRHVDKIHMVLPRVLPLLLRLARTKINGALEGIVAGIH